MTTLQLINKIADTQEITNVVIKDMDDKTPIDAIGYLGYEYPYKTDWRIDTQSILVNGSLLVYDHGTETQAELWDELKRSFNCIENNTYTAAAKEWDRIREEFTLSRTDEKQQAKILITVRGGMIQAIVANSEIKVCVADFDNVASIMQDITNLQELINNRAEKRLDADLRALSKTIRESRLLSVIADSIFPTLIYPKAPKKPLGTDDTKEEYPFWIFKDNSLFMKAVKDYWLPIYKSEEAQNFIQKVEDLSTDVANLLDNKEYDLTRWLRTGRT